MRLLEDEFIITSKEIEIIKKKYNLINIELAGIFKEKEEVFEGLNTKEVLYGIKNPSYVRTLLDDEEKFKERVEELYIGNKQARRIYNKVFKNEEKNIEKPCTREELIAFRKKFKISQFNFAKILGVTHKDIVSFEDGTRSHFNSKNVDIKYYINNPEEFEKKALEAKKKGIIPYDAFEKIHCVIIAEKVEQKKQLEKNKKIEREKLTVKRELETEVKTENDKEQENETMNQKIIQPRITIDTCKLTKTEYEKFEKRIKKLRVNAKREEREEFDGGKAKTEYRQLFINAVYDAYAAKVKLSMSDIQIVMNTILYHHDLISNQALRVCILGTLRSGSYERALKNIDELTDELDKEKYGASLLEFKTILNERYRKAKIQELRKEGKSDAQIAIFLRISVNEVKKLSGENIERE